MTDIRDEEVQRLSDRTVDNLVLSLRRKLDMDAEYGPIRAVRNVGYRMVPAATREG